MTQIKHSNFTAHILCAVLLQTLALTAQVIWGGFAIGKLAFPIHGYLFLLIITLAVIFCLILNQSKIGKFLASYQAAIVSICMLAFWAIVLGLTTQISPTSHAHDWAGELGLRQMTSFIPFVVCYVYLMICLTFATINRWKKGFSWRNVGFFCNHAGLLFTLYFIGAGAADVKQYTMIVTEGQTEWRATNDKTGETIELPIAIKLHDFVMEEYAPKLAIVHRGTGKVQPEERPEYFDIDTLRPKGKLMDWEIEVQQFFVNGIRANDSTYQEIPMPGACPAAFISAQNTRTGETKSSWISSGNNMQLYKFLAIGEKSDSLVIAMTQPEPKAFYSDVEVFLKSGEHVELQRIEVNNPLSADHWMVYQSDYDKALGTMSITSVFDLVFDPWRIYTIISVLLLAVGSLFWYSPS